MNEKFHIVLNSTISYVVAFLICTILHEFAHALIGMINQSEPVMHHNYVEHFAITDLSISQQVSIALAGPIFSLIQGIIAGWVFLNSKKKDLIQLFLLWFSVLGFNNFLGYLMTGPVFTVGDIGKAHILLGTPLFLQIIVAVLGALILLYIAYKMTRPFLEFSYKQEWVQDSTGRKNFSLHILILPWIIGSIIVTILYLPIIALISIIYPIMSGMVFIFPWQNAHGAENVALSQSNNIGRISPISIIILLVLVIVFRFILLPGIPL